MRKIYSLVVLAFCAFISVNAQAPAQSNAIMLQSFYWDSNSSTSWNQLYQISGDLSGYFDYVWLPPSAFSSGGVGYHPKQWSNQNSDWGTDAKLKQLINTLKANNCKVIADIVVNHRDNVSSWCDFYPDDFGTYGSFQFTSAHIVQNDEVNSDPAAGTCSGQATGANDTGEQYGNARDLDHTNIYVQNAVKAYLNFLKNEIGYDGWRYDVAKGFSPEYFGIYSDAAGSEISVGEYWDGNYNALWNWVNGTSNKSMAFDFAFKYNALNNGLAQNNYANMAWLDGTTPRPAGLIHSPQSRRYAVTFIENHDTEAARANGSNYTGDILKANAFMLSSPGIPCIFYSHWADAGNKTAIQNMMKARKSVGLHSESDVEVQNTAGYYKAFSVGTCGMMLTYIGNSASDWASDVPNSDGWTLNCSGTGWAIYTNISDLSCGSIYEQKIANGVNPDPDPTFNTITLSAVVPAEWTTPKIHVFNTASGQAQITSAPWPGDAMTQVEGSKYTITLSGFTASEVGVVINNGSNALQTVDLFATGNTCWIIDNAPTNGKYGATVDNNCIASAVSEIGTNRFSVYPNPVDNKLFITDNELLTVNNVEILDITGKIIAKREFDANSIDVSDLTKGIYFIKIGNQIEKFVKK